MDDDSKMRAALKSDDELHYCINNREKYLPESVEAAVAELQNRGVEFSEEELKVIAEDMKAHRNLIKAPGDSMNMFTRTDKNYQVEDPDAPLLYSKRAILVFSILFSVLFGSVMLAANVNKTQNITKAMLVILYGVGFTVMEIVIAESFHINSGFAFIFGYVGAYSMEIIFWKNYIGNSRMYRLKPIWVPLIIAIAILTLLILLLINSGALKS